MLKKDGSVSNKKEIPIDLKKSQPLTILIIVFDIKKIIKIYIFLILVLAYLVYGLVWRRGWVPLTPAWGRGCPWGRRRGSWSGRERRSTAAPPL